MENNPNEQVPQTPVDQVPQAPVDQAPQNAAPQPGQIPAGQAYQAPTAQTYQAPAGQPYQAPVYQAPVYQAPAQNVSRKDMPETPEDKKKANTMCIISLICMFVPSLISGVVTVMLSAALQGTGKSDFSTTSNVYELITSFIYLLTGAAEIASWVLMIYVRVKYPKNVFGKVLMILYIGLVVLGIIGTVILFIACIETLRSCNF